MGSSSNGKAVARLATYGEFDSPRTYQSIDVLHGRRSSTRRSTRFNSYIHQTNQCLTIASLSVYTTIGLPTIPRNPSLVHGLDIVLINKDMYRCAFCDKECNIRSYRNHQNRCTNNPNRQNPAQWAIGNRKGQKGSNAYLKARNLGIADPIVSMSTKEKMSSSAIIRNQNETEKTKQKRRDTIADKVKNGEWHTSLARHMHIDYNGVDLHGSWEVAYAKYLDTNKIRWIRNTDSFCYKFDGKERRYTPDFYLIDTDEYIEIKGYKTEKDDAKWLQFPIHRRLKILMHRDLQDLNII